MGGGKGGSTSGGSMTFDQWLSTPGPVMQGSGGSGESRAPATDTQTAGSPGKYNMGEVAKSAGKYGLISAPVGPVATLAGLIAGGVKEMYTQSREQTAPPGTPKISADQHKSLLGGDDEDEGYGGYGETDGDYDGTW